MMKQRLEVCGIPLHLMISEPDSDGAFGETEMDDDYPRIVIRISPKLAKMRDGRLVDPQGFLDTVIHEFIHGCEEVFGIELEHLDTHRVAHGLAQLFLQVGKFNIAGVKF